MANHHPTPELLAAFSAGNLPLSQALCVSAHAENCSECTANLSRLDALGAQMMGDLSAQSGVDELKTKVLDQLSDEAPLTPSMSRTIPPSSPSNIPRCLQQFIHSDYDALTWNYVSPSIKAAKLCTDTNGAKVEMLRIKPGGKAATHTHTGDEYTVILEGSFSDESGIYREGDFILRNGSHKHKPIASMDQECICLTVTHAPIKLTGFFTRWLNPLMNRQYLRS